MTGEIASSSAVKASIVALILLVGWWIALIYVDGWLAMSLPYAQYETVTLLYPEVYYPGLPGWILAGIQPFSFGIYISFFGGILAVAVIIGLGATWYAERHSQSPSIVAALTVFGLFIGLAVLEEIVLLIA